LITAVQTSADARPEIPKRIRAISAFMRILLKKFFISITIIF
jgi:hypothetical protein